MYGEGECEQRMSMRTYIDSYYIYIYICIHVCICACAYVPICLFISSNNKLPALGLNKVLSFDAGHVL